MKEAGLRVPDVIGPSEEVIDAITREWDSRLTVETELAREGFFPVTQPAFVFPEISLDILVSPDTREYTDIYRCVVAWMDYTRDKVARTELILLQMKNMKKEMERKRRRSFLSGTRANTRRPTVQELNDYIESEPAYIDLIKQMQYHQQKELVYKSELERYTDAFKLISRNVEIRRENWGAGSSQAGQPRFGMPGRMP
jgi:hypothetical protein